MDTPDNNSSSSSSINKLFELVNFVKSWIPGIRQSQAQPSNEGNASQSQSGNDGNVSRSRDFWMPDHSCRVCYECDSQFTIFNRRHHCRLCGRVFCAKCTTNSVPAPSDHPRYSTREDWERIRVCNYCFKQWSVQGTTVTRVDNDNGTQSHAPPSPAISRSLSATSVASSKSSCTYQSSCSTVVSTPYSAGPYQRVPYTSSAHSPPQSARMDSVMVEQHSLTSERSTGASFASAIVPPSPNRFGYCFEGSDDEDDDYGVCHLDSERRHISQDSDYYDAVNIDEIDHVYGPHNAHPNSDSNDLKNLSSLLLPENFDTKGEDGINKLREEVHEHDNCDGCEASAYDMESLDAEPVDFENNGLLWLPPEPEDKEDEREPVLFDDDGDDHSTAGEWGYLQSSNSFGSGESRSRDKSCEEHRKAMKNVVEGHFRALVSQLLQVENLPVGDEHDKESWLEIITSLSWEAATLLKPDTSKGEGMDPGGYVKVKCIASGCHSESVVVKGIVCKKNVAHRRMKTKIEKPRLLILGGALEYQRVTNHLSSFDTLLQQEMDHLKMAVAKIDAHHPNILLVEKSVSRYAQEYLLAKDISLVLNIKRPLLERIARCTGAKIVPSIDHFVTPKLGYCGSFHVEKFLEADGSAGRGGKKLTKTLMFFEGCPKPFGCTILLKGANEDELKKVKHVVQYGVFAAYHLALETSFLADEGASLPELPLKSPITVALPDKLSSIERSISTIPGFTVPGTVKPLDPKPFIKLQKSYSGGAPSTNSDPICKLEGASPTGLSKVLFSRPIDAEPAFCSVESSSSLTSLSSSEQGSSASFYSELSLNYALEEKNRTGPKESFQGQTVDTRKAITGDNLVSDSIGASGALQQGVPTSHTHGNALAANNLGSQDLGSLKGDTNNQNEGMGASKEEFPPSPSDHQSILVSLSSRCVWKGTVCERPHLLRIKYYGSFDKPLGRFLRDHLFDQSYRCRSCDMPSEAHVYCYTHQQGSLTISVKKLPEFLLPGEREGKIWMWHRCLKCPRTNGFPPATERVVMSDAAWGLSFGKFLELSFSNHAAASRVASCGHSLHRDCLRFYGFGRMVACFRYASIDVHSVYLPPQKLEFFYDNQEWIKTEVNELCKMAEGLFTEVYKALCKISENISSADSQDPGVKAPDSRHHIAELEGLLHKEKQEFEESVQKVIGKKVKFGQLTYDILEINKLRRQMLFHSYVWDQRLIHEARLSNNNLHEGLSSSIPKLVEKSVSSVEKLVEKAGKGYSSCDSLLETKPYVNLNQGGNAGHTKNPSELHKGSDMDLDMNHRKGVELSSSKNISDDSDPLKSGGNVRRAHSEGEYPILENLSDTLDAAWTGESHPVSVTLKDNGRSLPDLTVVNSVAAKSLVESFAVDQAGVEVASTLSSMLPPKPADNMEGSTSWVGMRFLNFYGSFSKNISFNAQKLGFGEYNPVYVSSFRELVRQNGARLLLPAGVNDIVVHVYDDEPTSVVAYALVSSDYLCQISEPDRAKNVLDPSVSLPLFDSVNLLSLNSFDEAILDSYRSLASTDESNLSVSGSRSSQAVDPLLYTKDLHVRVSFTDDGPLGKVKYIVTCYYAKRFEALRKTCCPSELDFVRSISRCKKWGAQGGKSNVFFAKTLDDRFIIKQVTKTELESFIKFAPAYFKYLSESISTRSPTCLAKILGIYQISLKHLKGGKESKLDVLVMENLLYRRNVTRLYDLKGSSRSRYNPDTSGSNKVLLDQNLIEAMPTSPIFLGNKAKRLLERAVWNDTSFLASIDVMDYSLLVGVDEEKHELVLGIIDFMRQYTWDKHLETWVKTSGILGGSKNTSPTVISPQQYKKRFRKAMTAYFVMVPDQWSSSILIPSGSQSDLCDENLQGGNFD